MKARANTDLKKPGLLNRIAGAIVGGLIGIPVGAVVTTVVGVGAMATSGAPSLAVGALIVGPFIGVAADLGLGVYDGARNGLTGLWQSIKDRSSNLANTEPAGSEVGREVAPSLEVEDVRNDNNLQQGQEQEVGQQQQQRSTTAMHAALGVDRESIAERRAQEKPVENCIEQEYDLMKAKQKLLAAEADIALAGDWLSKGNNATKPRSLTRDEHLGKLRAHARGTIPAALNNISSAQKVAEARVASAQVKIEKLQSKIAAKYTGRGKPVPKHLSAKLEKAEHSLESAQSMQADVQRGAEWLSTVAKNMGDALNPQSNSSQHSQADPNFKYVQDLLVGRSGGDGKSNDAQQESKSDVGPRR